MDSAMLLPVPRSILPRPIREWPIRPVAMDSADKNGGGADIKANVERDAADKNGDGAGIEDDSGLNDDALLEDGEIVPTLPATPTRARDYTSTQPSVQEEAASLAVGSLERIKDKRLKEGSVKRRKEGRMEQEHLKRKSIKEECAKPGAQEVGSLFGASDGDLPMPSGVSCKAFSTQCGARNCIKQYSFSSPRSPSMIGECESGKSQVFINCSFPLSSGKVSEEGPKISAEKVEFHSVQEGKVSVEGLDECLIIPCSKGTHERPMPPHPSTKKHPRASAIRDYPAGCGRNVHKSVWKTDQKRKLDIPATGFTERPSKKMACKMQRTNVTTFEKGPLSKKIHRVISRQADSVQRIDNRPFAKTELVAVGGALMNKLQNPQQITKNGHARLILKIKFKKDTVLQAEDKLPIRDGNLKKQKVAQVSDSLKNEGMGMCKAKSKILSIKHMNLQSGGPIDLFAGTSRVMNTAAGASAQSLVKQTLHEYDCVRKALVKSKACSRRPDLEAGSILRERGRWTNCNEKIVGEVPGVEVGDQFTFRMEMIIIGLHRQVQAGIDFISGSKRSNGFPVATSIVASGGYEDDDDGGDTFIYTGQGGNNYKGDRRQGKDQQLVRGNLALKGSMEMKTPVRVIRGAPDPTSPTEKLYTYDGLYDVIAFWFQTGVAGYGVYQFKLNRRPGQPQLGSAVVRFVGSLKKKGLTRPHVVLEDISGGKERLPVCLVNEVDSEILPSYFVYSAEMKYPKWYSPVLPRGCDCVGGCTDVKKCLCALKNGGEFPFNESGFMIWGNKDVVYECGSHCSCPSSCYNRVSQRGLRYQLEVFRTKKKGWGVRSLDSIRPGGFICEYAGELLSDAEAEGRVEDDEYLFDIGKRKSSVPDSSPAAEDTYCTINAKYVGNVARFINHSCSPNLFPQNVLFDSDDVRHAHVMLFSMGHIPPMRELTYDYNYGVGHVHDVYGNVKTKACYCGAQDCEGKLY